MRDVAQFHHLEMQVCKSQTGSIQECDGCWKFTVREAPLAKGLCLGISFSHPLFMDALRLLCRFALIILSSPQASILLYCFSSLLDFVLALSLLFCEEIPALVCSFLFLLCSVGRQTTLTYNWHFPGRLQVQTGFSYIIDGRAGEGRPGAYISPLQA